MDRKSLKYTAAAAAFLLLAINLYENHKIKSELEEVKRNFAQMESSMNMELQNIRANADRSYDDLKKELEKGFSMFSETSVTLAVRDAKLAVTIKAVPKEKAAGNRLFAIVTAGDQIYRQELNSEHETEIETNMAKIIKTAIVIESEDSSRQEELGLLYTSDYLRCKTASRWDGETLSFHILGNDQDPPFEASDIAAAEAILADCGTIEDTVTQGYNSSLGQNQNLSPGEEFPEAEFENLEGELIPLTETAVTSEEIAAYRLDLLKYLERKDGTDYKIYIKIRLKNGLSYRTESSVSEFSSTANSSSVSSGDGYLVPVF